MIVFDTHVRVRWLAPLMQLLPAAAPSAPSGPRADSTVRQVA